MAGEAWQGLVWRGTAGTDAPVTARYGPVWRAWLGAVRYRTAWRGRRGEGRTAWSGGAGTAGLGEVRHGRDRLGLAGVARLGRVRHGLAGVNGGIGGK